MIKYPLFVSLDTNIFDANHYNFSDKSSLGLLKKHVKENRIKVVLSDIVVREAERHIQSYCAETRRLFKKAQKDANKILPYSFIESLGFNNHLSLPDEADIKEKGKKELESFFQDIQAEILDMSQVDFVSIVDDYFEINAPFEKSERKRKEFPDAIIAFEIRKRFGDNDTVAIISNDTGLRKACKKTPNHLFFSTLSDLYDAISKRDQDYHNAIVFIENLFDSIMDEIHNNIDDDCIEVRDIPYDRYDIPYDRDYDEWYLGDGQLSSIKVHSIEDIDNKSIIAILDLQGEFTVDCFYDDRENAIWDSEEQDFLYLETLHIVEKHKAAFACRIEIKRESNEITVFPFKISLGSNSRISSYDYDVLVQDEDYRQDAEQVELGFQTLSGYADYLDSDLEKSILSRHIVDAFGKISGIGNRYEELSGIYDEFSDFLDRDVNTECLQRIIQALDSAQVSLPCLDDIPDNILRKEVIKRWADELAEKSMEYSEKLCLPDSIEYGETYELYGSGGKRYILKLDKLDSVPERGDCIFLNIELTNLVNSKVKTGYIELTVGYLDFDEEGNAGNGVDDQITYHCDSITDAITKIYKGLQEELASEERIATTIEQIMDSSES